MKKGILKKLILLILLTCTYCVYGQKRSLDVGAFVGMSSYFGDLTSVDHFADPLPNTGGVLLRYNVHTRFACRLNYNYTGLNVEGAFNGAGYSFSKNINDINVSAEVNYLRFRTGGKEHRWTSYVGLGVGVMSYNYYYDPAMLILLTPHPDYMPPTPTPYESSEMPIYVPVTFGIKADVSKTLTIGAEIVVKKMFASTLDDLLNPIGFEGASSMHNNDIIPVFGIHISYKLIIFARDCYGLD
ncbi:MAG: DUF6089 family protein [Bacteroidales bacterium]